MIYGNTLVITWMWVKPCHKPPSWEWFIHVYTTYLCWFGGSLLFYPHWSEYSEMVPYKKTAWGMGLRVKEYWGWIMPSWFWNIRRLRMPAQSKHWRSWRWCWIRLSYPGASSTPRAYIKGEATALGWFQDFYYLSILVGWTDNGENMI